MILKCKKYTLSLKLNETLLLVSLYLFFLDTENSEDCRGSLLILAANLFIGFSSLSLNPLSFPEQSHT